MKTAVCLLSLALAGCAAAPRERVDGRGVAARVGLASDAAYTAHRCTYAQALPDDDEADFVGGATCLVFPDRLAIVRARSRGDRPVYFRYKALEGVALASSGWRSQLQMLAAGTLLVVEMDGASANAAAQQRALATARREGVPEFPAAFVHGRTHGAAFVPPAF